MRIKPYERYYNRGLVERPVQSGFVSVSSTAGNIFDRIWYKRQTIYAPCSRGPIQVHEISCDSEEIKRSQLIRDLHEEDIVTQTYRQTVSSTGNDEV